MRIATYNVNSLNPRLPRLLAFLEEHDPDVVLLQETKCAPEQFPHAVLAQAGYLAADHSGGRWEGVAILGRASLGVGDVRIGLEGEPSPAQARWVEATVGDIRVVSVYVPNGQKVDSDPYKEKLIFFERMADRSAELFTGSLPVIIGGDMNVCLTDADAWDPSKLHGGTHATDAERQRFQAIIDCGYVDLHRHLHPDEPGFTWWDYRAGAFHKGWGLRIDYLLASRDIGETVTWCGIDRDFRKPTRVPESKPSDHVPLFADLDVELTPGQTATDDPVALVVSRTPEEPEQLGLL